MRMKRTQPSEDHMGDQGNRAPDMCLWNVVSNTHDPTYLADVTKKGGFFYEA